MSFLAKYWNVVERAVSETGMNAGDIKVDITEVLKNTDVDNTVVPSTETPETETNHTTPAQAGSMPDLETMEDMARRLARPSCDLEALESETFRTRTAKASVGKEESSVGDNLAEEIPRRSSTRGKKAKAKKALRKQLRKIGGGRRVNVILDEVKVNGERVWKSTSPSGES